MVNSVIVLSLIMQVCAVIVAFMGKYFCLHVYYKFFVLLKELHCNCVNIFVTAFFCVLIMIFLSDDVFANDKD